MFYSDDRHIGIHLQSSGDTRIKVDYRQRNNGTARAGINGGVLRQKGIDGHIGLYLKQDARRLF